MTDSEPTTVELQRCPRCWETAVNMTDPSGYKYRVCLGCGHVVTDAEAESAAT
jgi:hypothetical protein